MGFEKVIAANRSRVPKSTTTAAAPESPYFGAPDAMSRLDASRASAARLLEAGGEGVTDLERRQLEQIEEGGVASQAMSGLASVFNFLDRPRKAIALGIRDVFGFDERRGMEITGGDYWTALKGENEKLLEKFGEDLVGEGGSLGTSQLLDDVWHLDENTNLISKVGRGLFSLAGDVALDPITYVTAIYGGLGKKAATEAVKFTVTRAASRVAVKLSDDLGVSVTSGIRNLATRAAKEGADTAMEKTILAGARTQVDDIVAKALKGIDPIDLAGDEGRAIVAKATERAIREAIGLNEAGDIVGSVVGGVLTNPGSAGRILDQVGSRVATKTFGKNAKGFDSSIWGEYAEHVLTRRGGDRLGQTFTLGGVRLGVPFAIKSQTRPILQGSGRAISKTISSVPLKNKAIRRFSDQMKHWANLFDAKKPIVNAAKKGELLQFNALEAAARRTGMGFGDIGTDALRGWSAVAAVAKKAGMDEAQFKNVNRAMVTALQNDGNFEMALVNTFPKVVRAALVSEFPKMKSAYADAWGQLLKVSPEMAGIEGHVPFYLDQAWVKTAKRIPFIEVPADDVALRKLAAHYGIEDVDDLVRFAEVQSKLTPTVPKGASPGRAGELNRRTTGRGATAVRITDDLFMLDGPLFQDVVEISASLRDTMKKIIDVDDLPFKTKKLTDALVTDPGAQLATYISAVQQAAIERTLLIEGRRVGLLRQLPPHEVKDALAAQVAEGDKYVTELLDSVRARDNKALEAVRGRVLKTKSVNLGMGIRVDVPKILEDTPAVKAVLSRARSKIAKTERKRTKAIADRGRAVRQTMRDVPSLTEAQASRIVGFNSTMLDEFRFEMNAAVRSTAGEFREAIDLATRAAKYNSESLEMAVNANRLVDDWVRVQRDQLSKIDDAWEATMRGPQTAVATEETPLTVFDAAGEVDVIASRDLVNANILKPIHEGVAKTTAIRATMLTDEYDKLLDFGRQVQAAGPLEMLQNPMAIQSVREARLAQIGEELDYLGALGRGEVSLADYDVHMLRVAQFDDHTVGLLYYFEMSNLMEQAHEVLRTINPKDAKAGLASWRTFADNPLISAAALDDPRVAKLAAVGQFLEDGGDPKRLLDATNLTKTLEDSWALAAQDLDGFRLRHARAMREQAESTAADFAAATGRTEGVAPLKALANIFTDDDAFDTVVDNIDLLNELADSYLRSGARIEVFWDAGTPQVRVITPTAKTAKTVLPKNVNSMGAMADALDAGQISLKDLAAHEMGVVGTFSEIRRAAKAQANEIGSAKRIRSIDVKKVAEGRKAVDDLDKLITDVMTKKSSAARLRKFVYTFDSRGRARLSPEYNKVEAFIGESSPSAVAGLRRNIESLILADEVTSPMARRELLKNEPFWAANAVKPVEDSLRQIRNVLSEVEKAKAFTDEAEILEHLARVDTFVKEMSGFNDVVGSQVDEFGVVLGGGSKLVAYEKGVQAARKKALETLSNLGTATAREKKLVKKIKASLLPSDQTTFAAQLEGFRPASAFGIEGVLKGDLVEEYTGMMFENMVAATKALHTPQGVQEIRNAANEAISWWKSAATVSKPAFHERNAISGVANGFLIGVGPNNYRAIAKPLRTWRGMMNKNVPVEDMYRRMAKDFGGDTAEMFRAMSDNGVFQGFARSEGLRGSRRIRTVGQNLNLKNRDNVFFRTGGATMEMFEDYLRAAAFQRHYAGPGSEQLAAQMVMVAHFDYQNLTHLEQQFKKFAPFFVWTRRNLPLQLQMLVERPSMINMWNHLQRNMDQGPGDKGEFPLNQYASPLAARFNSTLNEDTPFWAKLILDPDLPVNVLDEFPIFTRPSPSGFMPINTGGPIEWLNFSADLLGPQFSLPLDMMAQEEFGDVNAPPGLNGLLNFFDKGMTIPFSESQGGQATIPRWVRSAVETALPFYSEYRQWLGFQPTDPKRLASEGYTPDSRGLAEILGGAALGRGLDLGELGDAAVRGPGRVGARGVGVEFQTPYDAKSATFTAQEIVSDVRARLARQATEEP